MTLIAKPIIKNKLWIVLDGANKIGNVTADEFGYTLQLGQSQAHFTSTENIESLSKIKFERPTAVDSELNSVYTIWPNTGKTYNNVMDIKRKIHIYTKTPKSKCYYASGWFKVKYNNEWETIFCPKYIMVTRYPYHGPFMTKQEADQA